MPLGGPGEEECEEAVDVVELPSSMESFPWSSVDDSLRITGCGNMGIDEPFGVVGGVFVDLLRDFLRFLLLPSPSQ